MLENAIQSFLGLRYESDRKAGSTSCNLISVTKSWNWKGKNWWNRRNELPDLQREKRPLDEIRLYNSMVLGIQNYFQLATCISIDCRKIHRQVMTVLTNRLNTETGCRLVREGGAMTESEKRTVWKVGNDTVCIWNRPTYLPYRIHQEQDTDGKESGSLQLHGRGTGIDTHEPKYELICSIRFEESTVYGAKHRTY